MVPEAAVPGQARSRAEIPPERGTVLVSRAAVAVHVITATTDTTVKTSRTVFEAPSSFTDEMTSTAISSGPDELVAGAGRDVRADADAGDRAEQHAAGQVQARGSRR